MPAIPTTAQEPFSQALAGLPVFVPGNRSGFSNEGLWFRVNVTITATGVATVTTPDGVQTVVPLTAALTQDVPLVQLPPNSYVTATRMKTSVAFVGTTTLTGTLGVTGADTLFNATANSLITAVSATNFFPLAGPGAAASNNTIAAINAVLGLTTTVTNLN